MGVVLSEVDGAVGRISLNRPEALNAITVQLGHELAIALERLALTCGVIVIRGAGGNFSVGGDFRELERLRSRGEEGVAELLDTFTRACALIAELPVPVVAAVEGYAMAGGFELMLASDIAIVRDDARLADNHANFDQVPGGGNSQRLPRIAGRQRAMGLILTGERITGEQAAAWGLAYRAAAPAEFDAAVEALVSRLAGHDREAMARSKRLVREGLELPLPDGLELERASVLAHLAGAGAAGGIERFDRRSGAPT